MATKTISITDEAYNALLSQKKNNESFTQTILRITKKTGKLTDSFGKWKMTDQEEQEILSELAQGWKNQRPKNPNMVSCTKKALLSEGLLQKRGLF
jgi:predicted CopG family antitoxin